MKKLLGAVFIIAVVGLLSCGPRPAGNAFSGVWRGALSDKEMSVPVELKLRETGGVVEGTFKIAGKTGADDITQGMTFEIIQAERIGDRLKFIVPLFVDPRTGEVDEDSIAFDLIVEGNTMTGSLKELKSWGEKIPITFTKR